jgi:RNA polymerase sigma-70 factor (ECF subfamily)
VADPTPTVDWLARIRDGDADAAEEVFARYAQRLTLLAEQHLSRKLAGRLDGEDVVQSVFRTFFRRSSAGEFRIDSSAQIWKLLVHITVRKAQALGRRETAQRRDVTAEVGGGDANLLETVGREPGPQEAAALVDEIEAILHGLPELYCHVLQMRLQGHEVAAIASDLGVSRQTVYRALHLLQQRLTRDALGDGTPR